MLDPFRFSLYSLGDVAAADGESGHQTRHFLVNKAVYDALLPKVSLSEYKVSK